MFRQLAPIDTDIPNRTSGSYIIDEGVSEISRHKDDVINTSLRGTSRSRIPSLTSLLTDPVYASKNEKLGIRKLAKACTKNLVLRTDISYSEGQNSDNDEAQVLNDNSRSAIRKSAGRKGSLITSDNWKTYFENDKGLKNFSESSTKAQVLVRTDGCHEDEGETTFADGSLTPRQQKRRSLVHKGDISNDMEKLKLYHSSHPVSSTSNEGKRSDVSDANTRAYNLKKYGNKRIVVVQDLPQLSGLNSVLSTVSGGPLERVVFRSNTKYSSKYGSVIELHYLNYSDAEAFMVFAETGLCIVNGSRLNVAWANKDNTEEMGIMHPIVPEYLLNEMKNDGASRCLIFKKNPKSEKPSKASISKSYPYPKTHFSDLNIESIKEDFAIFGGIVEVSPVISRKICFSIQFFDVRSAIVAKRECESEESSMRDKYKEWTIWYGKDPADKACIVI